MLLTFKSIDADSISIHADNKHGLIMASFLCPCTELVSQDINRHANLRGANPLQAQTIRLINSLKKDPSHFVYKCDAITLTAQDIYTSKTLATGKTEVVLEYPDDMDKESNKLTFGLINGGHRLEAMNFLNNIDALPEEAYIKVEVVAGPGVDNEFVNELVVTRNSNMAIAKNDVYNKQGKYDVLREIVEELDFSEEVAYQSGDISKNINPAQLCAIIATFSEQCHAYHPVLHTVIETKRNTMQIFHHAGQYAVEWMDRNKDIVRKNKEFFTQAIVLAGVMDEVATEFATKYPNNRLDLSRAKRYPLVKQSEEKWDKIRRPATQKLSCLIAGLSELTRYDETTKTYDFVPYASEFITKKRLADYVKQFLSSSEIFPDKNFKKDIAEYTNAEFRSNPKYFREAARIMRNEYAAFIVQKETKAANSVA